MDRGRSGHRNHGSRPRLQPDRRRVARLARSTRKGAAPLTPLLDVDRVTASYNGSPVVHGVSLRLERGDVLGLVGESGSGKTTLGRCVLGLLPENARVEGRILFEGRDLVAMPANEKRALLGSQLSAVFQNPMSSLDPAFTIGDQIVEVFHAHRDTARGEARTAAIRLLREVGIPAPEARLKSYPHELSGGMNQRVAIAIALALNPALLIADEPTSALDVTVQAQILRLLRSLIEEHAGAVLLITHDLGVVAQLCNRVAVMYAGEIVEEAPVRRLFAEPAHEYTKQLLASLPGRARRRRPDAAAEA
ncbi:MAG TPA: ABC transporter ATP-binding protein [Gaiellaceae bacterium]|nr:ABC transporter ATP-binding protein [Gaiellaceae bacterium]